jgi:hypothetical protein
MTAKRQKLPANKYEFGAFVITHLGKVVVLLCVIGLIFFILQIKRVKIGDAEIEKQGLNQTIKNVRR